MSRSGRGLLPGAGAGELAGGRPRCRRRLGRCRPTRRQRPSPGDRAPVIVDRRISAARAPCRRREPEVPRALVVVMPRRGEEACLDGIDLESDGRCSTGVSGALAFHRYLAGIGGPVSEAATMSAAGPDNPHPDAEAYRDPAEDAAAPPSLTFPDLPRLELDQLLAQLVDRAHEVMAAQGRLRGLLRASQVVTRDLALPVVLRRIAEATQGVGRGPVRGTRGHIADRRADRVRAQRHAG